MGGSIRTCVPFYRCGVITKTSCLVNMICQINYLTAVSLEKLFPLLNLFDFIVRGFLECVGVKGWIRGKLDGEALDFVDYRFSIHHMQIENMAAFGFVI